MKVGDYPIRDLLDSDEEDDEEEKNEGESGPKTTEDEDEI